MRHTITVTDEDIERGVRKSYKFCPIACAMRRKKWDVLAVIEQYAEIDVEGDEVKFKLPYDAQKFIVNFDTGKEVAPFEFEVDIDYNGPEDRDLKGV